MDELSCGVACIKYMLFAFNLIFALISIAIIAIGSVLVSGVGNVNNDITVPIILIVVGSVSFLVAFFGCCGAIKENTCLIYTYSTFVMILLIVQAILGIVILVTINDLLNSLNTSMTNLWNDRNNNLNIWNDIQQNNRCCGLQNAGQWLGNVPNSCCENTPCTAANAFPVGCLQVVRENFDLFLRVLAYIALGGAGVQLIGFIFSCVLAHNINKLS